LIPRLWSPRLPRDYAEQTYASPYWIVRYPHQRRFARAVELVHRCLPETVLDYGAGDGEFLRMLLGGSGPFPSKLIAYEPVMADLLQQRTESLRPEVLILDEYDDLFAATYDLIVCLGVLEHMPMPEREKFYGLCEERLNPGGRCVIDVPVEIGPSLLVKHIGRRLLKGRPSEYTLPDLIQRALGRKVVDPARHDPRSRETWILHHRGFDYRSLREELKQRFVLEQSFATPLKGLPPWLGNQEVFFLVAKRAKA
jgi:SAM-dependent methyltransferase